MAFFDKKPKVFVIGCNKTGTTSVAEALRMLDWKVAPQEPAELLLEDWGRRDFRALVRFCERAEAFQDIPFSLDWTWVALDHAFPRSRFILTVRGNADEWYESLTRFHTRIVGKGRLPTAQDLREFRGLYPGWMWRVQQLVYGIDEKTLYDRDIYIRNYEAHNAEVLRYFRDRMHDLLVLDIAQPDAMHELCNFLGVPDRGLKMPHLNASRDD